MKKNENVISNVEILDEESMNVAFDYIKESLFLDKTNLIYDQNVRRKTDDWPTDKECAKSYPNPCGYGTGMEDSMINSSTMLDACLLRYEKTGDVQAAEFAKILADGLLRCAEAAKSEGFLPRSLSPFDGKSHYIDSSRDQYTLFTFALHRYLNSPLCTANERNRIALAAVKIARRAEKNVIKENDYDMLREDMGKTLVSQMWGDKIENHEVMRLPMLYLFAWETSGDVHWLKCYRNIRCEAIQRSLPMGNYWHYYTLQQMQVSHRLCYDADPDKEWRQKHLDIMNKVSKYIIEKIGAIRESMENKNMYNMAQKTFRECEFTENARFKKINMPCIYPIREDAEEYFALQDCADVTIVSMLVPEAKINKHAEKLLGEAFSKIDFKLHERALPVYFLNAYYNMLP